MPVDMQINPGQSQIVENNDDNPDEYIPNILYLMVKCGVSLNFYQELCARFKDLNNLMMAIKSCGIYFYVTKQENGKMEWPSLLGNDKLKLLKQLPNKLSDCHPAEMVTEVQTLWWVCHRIYVFSNTLNYKRILEVFTLQ